jgi:hypothetical protein
MLPMPFHRLVGKGTAVRLQFARSVASLCPSPVRGRRLITTTGPGLINNAPSSSSSSALRLGAAARLGGPSSDSQQRWQPSRWLSTSSSGSGSLSSSSGHDDDHHDDEDLPTHGLHHLLESNPDRAKKADVAVQFQKKDGSVVTCKGKEGDILLRLAQSYGIELEGSRYYDGDKG